ncbi:MAG: transglycosylase domain-containing protein [Firmicutes bacterium]|nr:transglycosylase domain-containing protein [Bacillota bacterium]
MQTAQKPREYFSWQRGLWTLGVLLLVASMGRLAWFYHAYWPQVSHFPRYVKKQARSRGAQWVPLSQVSPIFTKALIATEDRTFYTNWGVSIEGIGRALVVDLSTGKYTQGGSTLTEQVVRDTLLSQRKTMRRKIKGALLAVMLTVLYPKRQILSCYVNRVYLGNGAYGIEQASQRYFGTTAKRLTLAQASLLAGLPQAPSYLDPLVHLHAAKARQRIVLHNMVVVHDISRSRAQKAYRQPLHLV